jgi:hypothetical protein
MILARASNGSAVVSNVNVTLFKSRRPARRGSLYVCNLQWPLIVEQWQGEFFVVSPLQRFDRAGMADRLSSK